jgi:hypothetical protein
MNFTSKPMRSGPFALADQKAEVLPPVAASQRRMDPSDSPQKGQRPAQHDPGATQRKMKKLAWS